MQRLGRKEFQEVSEIEIFNEIGDIASSLGYNPVYFKALKPVFVEMEEGIYE